MLANLNCYTCAACHCGDLFVLIIFAYYAMSLCEFVLLLCLWGVPAWPSSVVLTHVNIFLVITV